MSQASSLPSAGMAGGGARGRKVQLGAMMFLQYAIWGAYAPVLSGVHVRTISDSVGELKSGGCMGCLPLATIIAPDHRRPGCRSVLFFGAQSSACCSSVAGGDRAVCRLARTTEFDHA